MKDKKKIIIVVFGISAIVVLLVYACLLYSLYSNSEIRLNPGFMSNDKGLRCYADGYNGDFTSKYKCCGETVDTTPCDEDYGCSMSTTFTCK